ncbi:MAG: AlpA family phage regulatory protein [Rhodospirillales bacterium]|nr:AlpA family phage regulatory protein [Rhodospirillales bacterium]
MTKEIQPRMMRMRQLTEYCALSRAYIYQKINEGSFPRGHKLSIGITAWERSEIDAWLDRQMGSAYK